MRAEKKKELSDFHRCSIQKAAERLFLERGFTDVSVDDIAKEAGYSKATLYVYFDNKTAIWEGVLDSSIHRLKDRLNDVMQTDEDALEKYYSFCKTTRVFSEEYPLFFEGIVGSFSPAMNDLETQMYKSREEVFVLIEQLIKQGIHERVFKPDVRVSQMSYIFWSCISSLIRMANQNEVFVTSTTDYSKEEFLQYGFETFLNGIKQKKVWRWNRRKR